MPTLLGIKSMVRWTGFEDVLRHACLYICSLASLWIHTGRFRGADRKCTLRERRARWEAEKKSYISISVQLVPSGCKGLRLLATDAQQTQGKQVSTPQVNGNGTALIPESSRCRETITKTPRSRNDSVFIHFDAPAITGRSFNAQTLKHKIHQSSSLPSPSFALLKTQQKTKMVSIVLHASEPSSSYVVSTER